MQQNTLYTWEENASLFVSNTAAPCDYNITKGVPNSDTISENKSTIISPMGISCVDIFVGVGMSPDAVLLWRTFFPGSYFLLLAVRWSFFSATAKSLVICSCGYLELNNFS